MMTENRAIEYKSKLTDNFEREVVAFLNTHEGGCIYIGINKHGRYVGVPDADHVQLAIKDRLKNNILPSCMGLFDVILEEYEGKDVIKLVVVGGLERPYYIRKYGMSEKGALIRVGSSAEPMSQAMIDKLYASRTRNSIGKIRSYFQDLRFEQLRIYYQEQDKPLNPQFRKTLELFTEDSQFNYAAYLLADDNNVSIKVAKYSGTDRVNLIENNEYGFCSIVKATKSVIDKIELENRTMSQITPRERIDTRLWNQIALREAIINAIVHNDYTREVPPKFEIFVDRIEITSYGSLIDGLDKKDFFAGVSIPRNRELMRVYRDLELVEQLGSGIPRILQSYGRECFVFLTNFTRMVFPKSVIDSGLVDGLVDRLVDGLVDTQQKILGLVHVNPKVSKRVMADHIGVSTTTIDKHIQILRNRSILERVGSDRTGYWKINVVPEK